MEHEKITLDEFTDILILSKHTLSHMTRAEIDQLIDFLLKPESKDQQLPNDTSD